MAKQRILIVHDEEAILELIEYNLTKEGYQVECVTSGERALSRAREPARSDGARPDAARPRGLEVCKALKNGAKTSRIPILMLTAKGDDSDVIAGLELGAEDYITKPFSPKVLIARIRTAGDNNSFNL
ncbi:MAG: response regulator [Candidatus Alcyoniella australis]|nr:response regulator [Candidatus Alcyoniella australis]